MKKVLLFLGIIFCLVVHLFIPAHAETGAPEHSLRETIETLSSFGSRATGSAGYEKAVDFVEAEVGSPRT